MAFFGLIGNDKDLAQRYQGRESASTKASRQRRQGHRRSVTAAARQGQAWEDTTRSRQDGRSNWWRGDAR